MRCYAVVKNDIGLSGEKVTLYYNFSNRRFMVFDGKIANQITFCKDTAEKALDEVSHLAEFEISQVGK